MLRAALERSLESSQGSPLVTCSLRLGVWENLAHVRGGAIAAQVDWGRVLGSVGAALAAALQAISWAAVAGLGSGITILSMSGDSSDSRANAEAAKDAAAADISTPATPPDDDDPCNLFESLDCIGDGTSEVGFPRNSVDDILASGLSPRKGNLTNAGREYQKHMGRGGGGGTPPCARKGHEYGRARAPREYSDVADNTHTGHHNWTRTWRNGLHPRRWHRCRS